MNGPAIVLLLASLLLSLPGQDTASTQTRPAPQDSSTTQDGSEVAVMSFAWGVAQRRVNAEDPTFSATTAGRRPTTIGDSANSMGIPSNTPPPSPRGLPPAARSPMGDGGGGVVETVVIRRETYVQLKNSGGRTIKAVSWDYLFFSDQGMQHEVKRYKFRTKKRIAPGEVKFLSEYVTKRADSRYQRVVINRIEFTDGSVWQRQ